MTFKEGDIVTPADEYSRFELAVLGLTPGNRTRRWQHGQDRFELDTVESLVYKSNSLESLEAFTHLNLPRFSRPLRR